MTAAAQKADASALTIACAAGVFHINGTDDHLRHACVAHALTARRCKRAPFLGFLAADSTVSDALGAEISNEREGYTVKLSLVISATGVDLAAIPRRDIETFPVAAALIVSAFAQQARVTSSNIPPRCNLDYFKSVDIARRVSLLTVGPAS